MPRVCEQRRVDWIRLLTSCCGCCGRRPIFIGRSANPVDPSRKMFKPQTKAFCRSICKGIVPSRVDLVWWSRKAWLYRMCDLHRLRSLKHPDLHSLTSHTCPTDTLHDPPNELLSFNPFGFWDTRRFCNESHATSLLISVCFNQSRASVELV